VTHSPEQEAIEAYKRLKLPVLLVKPEWEDLEKLKSGLGLVEAWQAPCKAKHCPKCGKPMEEVVVGAVEGARCYKCGQLVPVFRLIHNGKNYPIPTTRGIIKPAKRIGVIIALSHISVGGPWIYLLKCPTCGTSLGVDWYGSGRFETEVVKNKVAIKTKPFYRCEHCDTWLEKKRAVKSITALQTLIPPDVEKGA